MAPPPRGAGAAKALASASVARRQKDARLARGRRPLSRSERNQLSEYGTLDNVLEDAGGPDDHSAGASDRIVRVIDETEPTETKRRRKRAVRRGRRRTRRRSRRADGRAGERRPALRAGATQAAAPTASLDEAEAEPEPAPEDDAGGADWAAPAALQTLVASLKSATKKRPGPRPEAAPQRPAPAPAAAEADRVDPDGPNDPAEDDPADLEEDDAEEAQALRDAEDWFQVHFGDSAQEEIATTVELMEASGMKWHQRAHTSPVLGQVTLFDALEGATDGDAAEGALVPPGPGNASDFGIKPKVWASWTRLHPKPMSALQAGLLTYLTEYKDVFFARRTIRHEDELWSACLLHVVNHVVKARDRVLKANAKLRAHDYATGLPEEHRDQGFTRPRALILLPTRHAALQVVQRLLSLLPGAPGLQVENKKRFLAEYGQPRDEADEERRANIEAGRPADWMHQFAGNVDDCFRVGIRCMPKAAKIYADFYTSDILVASPLGLRLLIGAEGERQRDFDFLSSIEVVVVDPLHVIAMQNWDHLLHVMDHLNLTPKDPHDCDFSRVRSWCLDGHGKYVRQTILVSDYIFPDANAFFHRRCNTHYAGKVRIRELSYSGSISMVIPQVQQVFHRIVTPVAEAAEDVRFTYFVEKPPEAGHAQVLKPLRAAGASKHTAIFLPTYLDFTRLRKHLRENDVEFLGISEYTSAPDVSRARAKFYNGVVDLMLYTERFHFYWRYKIRGIRNLIFYALPENAGFYPELLNMLESTDVSCAALFTTLDFLRLERVVGSDRAKRMVATDKPLFMFC